MKIRLDVIAKGYIADKDARMVCPADIRDFLFNAEGEIVADGDKKKQTLAHSRGDAGKYRGNTVHPAIRN